jgi:hypothetical protein
METRVISKPHPGPADQSYRFRGWEPGGLLTRAQRQDIDSAGSSKAIEGVFRLGWAFLYSLTVTCVAKRIDVCIPVYLHMHTVRPARSCSSVPKLETGAPKCRTCQPEE